MVASHNNAVLHTVEMMKIYVIASIVSGCSLSSIGTVIVLQFQIWTICADGVTSL